jgi:hypothetical protein
MPTMAVLAGAAMAGVPLHTAALTHRELREAIATFGSAI